MLNIRQASISDAKRRSAIPSDWLVTLLDLRGVNPYWIMNGIGPKFLTPSANPGSDISEVLSEPAVQGEEIKPPYEIRSYQIPGYVLQEEHELLTL